MKLFYFANSRIPTEKAHGIQIMNMAESFAQNDAVVTLILPTRKNSPFKNTDPFEYYGVEKIFKIKKIFCPDPNFLMHLPDGIYIKVQSFFFIIGLYFYLLFHCRGVLQYAPARNDNIFYTRDEYLLPVLQKFSNRVVWEAHTLPKNKKHYLKYWQRCHKIIAITKGIKDELVNLGLDAEKILIAPDGVNIKNFQFPISNFQINYKSQIRKKLSLPIDKKNIMYTGHLYAWKGVDTLLDAARFFVIPSEAERSRGIYKNFDLLFVFLGGTEYDVKNFQEKAKDLSNVLILGHKPPNEIPEYLQAADILILPNSKNDEKSNWTSPLKMFEYMASGKPIIASDLPVIREILNENNAILIEPDNAESLGSGINTALQNQELCDKISAQASQDVQNYTWQKRTEKIITFIK